MNMGCGLHLMKIPDSAIRTRTHRCRGKGWFELTQLLHGSPTHFIRLAGVSSLMNQLIRMTEAYLFLEHPAFNARSGLLFTSLRPKNTFTIESLYKLRRKGEGAG